MKLKFSGINPNCDPDLLGYGLFLNVVFVLFKIGFPSKHL